VNDSAVTADRTRQQTLRVAGLVSATTMKPVYRIGEGEASSLERPCIKKYAINNLRPFWTELGGEGTAEIRTESTRTNKK
jgi:hypothetical protein